MFDSLDQLNSGSIIFSDPEGGKRFESHETQLQARWNISDNRAYSRLAFDGALGFAESYLQDEWQTDDLTTLLRILYRLEESNCTFSGSIANLGHRAMHHLRRNSRKGSRKNIAHHYDLSNDFFELFLDPTMMYSSAYFDEPNASLEQASIAKLDRICHKLELSRGDEVLEIGTGWGGFALHAVPKYDIHLTSTTISAAQLDKAEQRIAHANLTDKVTLLEKDYRDLSGCFDKLVSIEMIEAVGEQYLDDYFRQCSSLLKDDGRMVIQGIVMPEQRYDSYRRSVDFIQEYVFPGGFLPSIGAIQQSVGRSSDLRLVDIEDLSPHYAETLRRWRTNFLDRLSDVRQLGFDERFIRMWEYYLCYCEAAFLEKAVRVVQIVWDKPHRRAATLNHQRESQRLVG